MRLTVRIIDCVCEKSSGIFIKYLMFSSRKYEKVGLLVVVLAIMGARKIFGVFCSGESFMSNKEDESVVSLWII